jgi:anti-sigma regulatory factor (Ser/Thr protein kinase)
MRSSIIDFLYDIVPSGQSCRSHTGHLARPSRPTRHLCHHARTVTTTAARAGSGSDLDAAAARRRRVESAAVSGTLWAPRPQPSLGSGAVSLGRWRLGTPADVTAFRARLRDEVITGRREGRGDDDALERLLLAFEELTSNGLRHGRPPVQVAVTATESNWLIDVTDAAVDRPPTPAVDRDAAEGGLGLYLVARLCSSYGWTVQQDRKHVWACIERHATRSADRGALDR